MNRDHEQLPIWEALNNANVCTPLKTNVTLEDPPFEDVFPIENGDFPMSFSFQWCKFEEFLH